MIKGVVFDADGTLLDSMHIWDELGERYLRSLGKTPEDGLYKILFPMTLEESSVYLKEKYGLTESTEEIKSGVLGIIDSFYRNEVQLKAGVREFLEYLSEKNIPAVIATTSDKTQLQAAFTRLGVIGYFRDIITCSELKTNKREPYIYLKATQLLATEINETAVFEDVLYAVKTAKTAGFFTVGVEDTASISDRDEIIKTADLFIGDFTVPELQKI